MRNIPLGTITISDTAKKNIQAVLDTRRVSYGDFCREFETRFAELHDCTTGIFCSSGTAALHTILTALKRRYGWSDGDEVLVPVVTFVATINVVLLAGLKPVFVDISQKDFGIDPEHLDRAITSRTRAIIPVHLFGIPAQMPKIMEFATTHGLLVVEDCCEAVATKIDTQAVGSFGVAAAFSTHSAHIITTGVGGMITTNDPELAQYMRVLINHGRSPEYLSIDDDDALSKQELATVVDNRFSFIEVGFSYRISELEAAIGVAQLDALEDIAAQRKKIAQQLAKKLQDLKNWIQVPSKKMTSQVLMAFPVLISSAQLAARPSLASECVHYLERYGIETRPFLPILGQPAYEFLHLQPADFPVGAYCTQAGFYLGSHQDMTEEDVAYISDTLHAFFSSCIKV